jgi:hypothetical protein
MWFGNSPTFQEELIASILRVEEYAKQETSRSRGLASSGFVLGSFLNLED